MFMYNKWQKMYNAIGKTQAHITVQVAQESIEVT